MYSLNLKKKSRAETRQMKKANIKNYYLYRWSNKPKQMVRHSMNNSEHMVTHSINNSEGYLLPTSYFQAVKLKKLKEKGEE